ncbi:MAG: hypothetical protein RRA35_00860 [Desulfomonilia bacterium]|nr:hypothetical protein [Desulfomonilia bacterium]
MLKNTKLWYVLMAGALAGWAFAIRGLVKPYENEVLDKLSNKVLMIWGLGHPLELFVSMGIARRAGLSPIRAIIKTVLFGFTWWMPVKLGVFRK